MAHMQHFFPLLYSSGSCSRVIQLSLAAALPIPSRPQTGQWRPWLPFIEGIQFRFGLSPTVCPQERPDCSQLGSLSFLTLLLSRSAQLQATGCLSSHRVAIGLHGPPQKNGGGKTNIDCTWLDLYTKHKCTQSERCGRSFLLAMVAPRCRLFS